MKKVRSSVYWTDLALVLLVGGLIGFHHIHHLSPRIPNYLLEKCHDENPMFQETVILTLRSSLKSVFLGLWDEEQKKLISFSQLKQCQPEMTRIS